MSEDRLQESTSSSCLSQSPPKFNYLVDSENLTEACMMAVNSVPLSTPSPLDLNINSEERGEKALGKRWLLCCPSCEKFKANFFCHHCIKNGGFFRLNSKERVPERFAEKKFKYFKYKEDEDFLNEQIKIYLQKELEKEKLVSTNFDIGFRIC